MRWRRGGRDWLRGALATVDRSYGILNYFHHHIADTHVAHHLFSQARSNPLCSMRWARFVPRCCPVIGQLHFMANSIPSAHRFSSAVW